MGEAAANTSSAARHAARTAAVQALYQMELTSGDAEEVAQEFIEHRFGGDTGPVSAPDEEFFSAILNGVPQHQVEIDRSVARCLSSDWKLERIDSILRAILRAATFEFIDRKDVPAKVVIDEYVEISHAFFSADEPAFVNAVLDKLAHRKRAPEFGETPPDDELQF
ncbi:MAG TPA: transcription antitermination factor NusB [Rhizomicrobium sp.]|jgi:N utilization substance protein B|nr:transcription antitermination factor NusB [Rhizomicrobium sp.]